MLPDVSQTAECTERLHKQKKHTKNKISFKCKVFAVVLQTGHALALSRLINVYFWESTDR